MEKMISAREAAFSSTAFSAISLDNGNLYVIESRPAEKGRRVLLKNGEEVLGCHISVNSTLHEYGGGEYLVHNDIIYFANHEDQRWYQQKPNQLPIPITPAAVNKGSLCFADPCITPDGHYLICVQEKQVNGQDLRHSIVAIKTDGSQLIIPLVEGDDFYSSPCVSPDGKKMAWISWNHPQMPWDGCELHVATLRKSEATDAIPTLRKSEATDAISLADAQCVAGSTTELMYQPSWYSNNALCFVSDETGYANLYSMSLRGAERRRNLFPINADCFYPQWVFGTSCYVVIAPDTFVVLVTDQGQQSLWLIEKNKKQKIELPFTFFAPYIKSDGEFIYVIASSPTELPTLIRITLRGAKRRRNLLPLCDIQEITSSQAPRDIQEITSSQAPRDIQEITSSQAPRDIQEIASVAGALSQHDVSTPSPFVFPTENNRHAYGFYYPAQNTAQKLPPLIVISHGGPTASTSTSLNLKIQFWTSHGFAVMDVNYGGSTGYGREYRERLKNNWGIVDVQDCVNAARYCVKNRMADPDKLIIRGSSAGGFTTLCALIFYDVFKVGASYYGVADLFGLLKDTHKFEARYLDQLIGEYPKYKKRYEERSPLLHAEKLLCPVIFFQGLKDKVVPPEQAEKMIAAMQENNIPYEYITFEEEGHGFRQGDNIAAALEAELAFYQKHLNL